MSDLTTCIELATELARSLYTSGDLSTDQASPIIEALQAAALEIAGLERGHATLTQQLAGCEAEAAARTLAIERFLDTCPYCRLGQCSADSHQALRAALAPEAGQQLRRLIADCAAAVGDADHYLPSSPLRVLALKLLPYRREHHG